MAKDGTKRGGARPGAGRKKKPLNTRSSVGRDAVVMDTDGLESKEMPDVKEYLKADQAMGGTSRCGNIRGGMELVKRPGLRGTCEPTAH